MNGTRQKVLLAIGILILVVLGLSTLAGGMMAGHMFNPSSPDGIGNQNWMWGLGMGFGGLLMLVFWGAIIAGIVWLVREVGHKDSVPREATPLDVLKRRYAAGEITREQYEQMKQDLEE